MALASVRDLVVQRHLGVAFTRREALEAGITLAQLRGPFVSTVFRGVFTISDPTDLVVRSRAAVKLAGPAARICETTALALMGVELPDATLTETVHVWVPAGVAGPSMVGIRVHHGGLKLSAKQVTTGVKTVHPAECWLQSAATLSIRDLVVVADGLTRRQDPILFTSELHELVANSAGCPGVRKIRSALELVRTGTDSPTETLLRLILVDAGLPCPQVNYPLRGPDCTTSYYLDMAYPQAKVAVEYDGAYHVANSVQMRRDQTRRRRIEDCGWRIITATSDDLRNPASLVESVRGALVAAV